MIKAADFVLGIGFRDGYVYPAFMLITKSVNRLHQSSNAFGWHPAFQ